MNKAILVVSTDLLRQALHLPDDAEILTAFALPECPGQVRFVVQHPDLLPTPEGGTVPQVNPTFVTRYDQTAPTAEFVAW